MTLEEDLTIDAGESLTIPQNATLTIKQGGTLTVGGTETLTATVLPEGAGNRAVPWSSDHTTVAAVDANGRVTAVAKGIATITVTTADGGYTAACTVKVRPRSSSGDSEPTYAPVPGRGERLHGEGEPPHLGGGGGGHPHRHPRREV